MEIMRCIKFIRCPIWLHSMLSNANQSQTHYGIFWPREWPFIKLTRIKLGNQIHKNIIPAKVRAHPPQPIVRNEWKCRPLHPRPKQDDRQQKLLVPTNQNVQWKKVCLIRKPKNHMGKIGNVSPNQCCHTKPLGAKGKKDSTLKIKKTHECVSPAFF